MKKILIMSLFLVTAVFAAGEKMAEIKKDLLISDPQYMTNHKEEALAEKVVATSQQNDVIPKRTPDKYVTVFLLPYIDSSDAYHDQSIVAHKYKAGKWIFGEKTNIEDQSDVTADDSGNEFTYFDGDK